VLVCTSTLALGVNLPAHLVIIKSTQQMVKVSALQKHLPLIKCTQQMAKVNGVKDKSRLLTFILIPLLK
jgi:hypothetical protein